MKTSLRLFLTLAALAVPAALATAPDAQARTTRHSTQASNTTHHASSAKRTHRHHASRSRSHRPVAATPQQDG